MMLPSFRPPSRLLGAAAVVVGLSLSASHTSLESSVNVNAASFGKIKSLGRRAQDRKRRAEEKRLGGEQMQEEILRKKNAEKEESLKKKQIEEKQKENLAFIQTQVSTQAQTNTGSQISALSHAAIRARYHFVIFLHRAANNNIVTYRQTFITYRIELHR
jgi:hypothetical protein